MDRLTVNRFRELYDALGTRTIIFKNILWVEYNKMVVSIGPINHDYTLLKSEALSLLSCFPKAILLRTTGQFDTFNCSSWYSVVCMKAMDFTKMRPRERRRLEEGLNNFKIQRITADYIARHGFDVYISAYERYRGNSKPLFDRKTFNDNAIIKGKFDDIVHYWGVFYNDKLVAYSESMVYGNTEIEVLITKFIPEYLKLYSSYALEYEMIQYYLKNFNYQYINSGFRTLLHESNRQKFLIEKFGFRKAFIKIDVIYKPLVNRFIGFSFPFRNFLKNFNPKLEALFKQEEINQECKRYT